MCPSIKILRGILDAKYWKEDLNKVTKEKSQHLTEYQHNYLLGLLQKIEDFFDGTIGTWKMDPIYFVLKENMKEVF